MDMISSPNNKKLLWHYIKAQRQEHTGIGTLNIDHIITDQAEKENILNKQFESVFTVEDRETIHLFQTLRSPLSEYIIYYLTVTHINH